MHPEVFPNVSDFAGAGLPPGLEAPTLLLLQWQVVKVEVWDACWHAPCPA